MSLPRGRPKGIHRGRPRGAQKGNRNAVRAMRRVKITGSVAPETKAYIETMRAKMPVGELLDAAIKLYREVNEGVILGTHT